MATTTTRLRMRALLLLGAPSAQATHRIPREVREELRELRSVMMKYRDVAAAEADGYVAASPCESDPKYGAMGFHYANEEHLSDGVLDPLRPEILVYHEGENGQLRLGAIEYFQVDADQDLHTFDDRPEMFGVPFDGPMLGHNETMPIHYDLHVWLFRHNPAGIFAAWNPRVHCAEEDGDDDANAGAEKGNAEASAAGEDAQG